MDQTKNTELDVKELMKYEWMRFASFSKFPLDSPVHTIRLAEAGFYFQGHEDEVTCFSCDVKYKGWKKEDIPLQVHKTISPNCPFLSVGSGLNVGFEKSPWGSMLDADKHTRSSSVSKQTSDSEAVLENITRNIDHVDDQNTRTREKIPFQNTNGACCDPHNIKTPSCDTGKPKYPKNGFPLSQMNKSKGTNELGSNGEPLRSPVEEKVRAGFSGKANSQNTSPNALQNNGHLAQQCSIPNIPKYNTETNDENMTLDRTTSQSSKQAIQETRSFKLEPLGVSFDRPVFQQYAVLSTRLSTFKKWPKNVTQRPEVLAKAGLFHEGIADRVRCFFCGGGLFNWDSDDDPWIEHARWYPRCIYLRQNKGDEFIYRVQDQVQKGIEDFSWIKEEKEDNPGSLNESPSLISQMTGNLISHPAAISVLEMGVSADLVEKAIHALLLTKANIITAEKVLEKAWAIEEGETARNKDEENDISSTETLDKNTPAESKSNGCFPTAENNNSLDSNSRNKNENEGERIAIMEENRHLRELQICKICLDEDVSIVFLPCGHMATCASCAPALRKCPICRTFIKATVKAIIS